MSGDKKLTAEAKLATLEKILDEYQHSVGTAYVIYNTEVSSLLSLSRDELKNYDAEECGMGSVMLSQYSIYVQKEQNRQNTRVYWATRELDLLVAVQEQNYGDSYVKYDVKRDKIISADSYAKKLYQIIKHAKSRSIELEFLSSKIALVAKALQDLQQTKRQLQYHRET